MKVLSWYFVPVCMLCIHMSVWLPVAFNVVGFQVHYLLNAL